MTRLAMVKPYSSHRVNVGFLKFHSQKQARPSSDSQQEAMCFCFILIWGHQMD